MFLGLGRPKDNDQYNESEKHYNEARRRAFLKRQEEEKANGGRKPSRGDRFRSGFRTAEVKLDAAVNKLEVTHKYVTESTNRYQRFDARLAERGKSLRLSPDNSLYGFKALHSPEASTLPEPDNLTAMFSPNHNPQPSRFGGKRKVNDGLSAAFDLTPPKGSKQRSPKNDPLHAMFSIAPQKRSKGKRKSKDFWSL